MGKHVEKNEFFWRVVRISIRTLKVGESVTKIIGMAHSIKTTEVETYIFLIRCEGFLMHFCWLLFLPNFLTLPINLQL